MSKTVTIGLSLAVGVVIGIAGRGWVLDPPAGAQTSAIPISFSAVPGAVGAEDVSGPYEVQRGVAEGPQHASGPREMDLRRGARHLRREPEPRVSARRRRAAEHEASADAIADRYRSERAVPRSGPAVAQRQHRFAAGRRRHRARIPRREWRCGGATSRLIARWASMRAGITRSSSSMRRATSSRTGRSGTTCSSARTRSTSVRTTRRSTSGSSTTTPMRST